MSQLDTIKLRDELITRSTEFALDDHFVRDPLLREAMRKIWSGPPELGGLGSDLWVEGAFPSKTSAKTPGDLAVEGALHPDLVSQLDRSGAFPSTRLLYQHQLDSVMASRMGAESARPAIVVTAGTGAGKTESFLLPMLNALWSTSRRSGGGIRALILYPMNALVTDQVGRLDQWLADQGKVSFFHFTSATPEDAKAANQRGLPKATAARFRTRQQARGREDRDGKKVLGDAGPQPDILVTNYSMLEYMLCRPQDACFFSENLEVIILDEAHIYSGNLAAEITLLLRRVLLRCNRRPEDVLCLATSATMGGGAEELRPFASKLFTKPEELVQVIRGGLERPELEAAAAPQPLPIALAASLCAFPLPDEETLESGPSPKFKTASADCWQGWHEILVGLDLLPPETQGVSWEVAPLLARALTRFPALALLQDLLWNQERPQRMPLRELSARLFGTDDPTTSEATRRLLHWGAIARLKPSDLPLLPNRVHYLMRGPEGLQMGFSESDAPALVPAGPGRWLWSNGADPVALGTRALHPLTLFRCKESGWCGVASEQQDGHLNPVRESILLYGEEIPAPEEAAAQGQQPSRVCFFSLGEVAGRPMRRFDPSTGRYGAVGSVCLWEVERCPVSDAELNSGTVGWFASRARLQLSLLAETALAMMPEYGADNRKWKPARGRRLLVFSDSRAEASRLGPGLTRQHELFVFRAAVVDRLEQVNMAGSEEDIRQQQEEVDRITRNLQTARPALRPGMERQLREAIETLRSLGEAGTLLDWVDTLKDSSIIRELLDLDAADKHKPGDENAFELWKRNTEGIQSSLTGLLGRELAVRPTWPQMTLETLGLIEVVYPGIGNLTPPAMLLGQLPADAAAALGQVWPEYMAGLLDTLRADGAITLGSKENDQAYQYGEGRLGKWVCLHHSYRSSHLALIGKEFEGGRVSRRNAFTRNVLLTVGADSARINDLSRECMVAAYEVLYQQAQSNGLRWLASDPSAPSDGGGVATAIQIKFDGLGLRRPSKLYRCRATGQVWPRQVAGFYPKAKTASLEAVGTEDLDNDKRLGRRRRELKEWFGFHLGCWAEEHSAQLSPQENERLQNLFREGMRNILSSTTTLELGIDIGGLSAVLLGNMPPGKANYLQRAGRAGRRSDGTSAVLGFARPSSYEREVFLHFGDYLARDLRRPTVFLDRAPLVQRHAHAWLLGEFFREHGRQGDRAGAMTAFGNMGVFAGEPLPITWNKDNENKPDLASRIENPLALQFKQYLKDLEVGAAPYQPEVLQRLWAGCGNVQNSSSFWSDNLRSFHSAFTNCLDEWRALYRELLDAWSSVPARAVDGNHLRAQANAICYQLRALHSLTVIEALADARFLPRYGFPIGVSRLRVQVPATDRENPRVREEDAFRLERQNMQALREYTPGSQLLVGKKVVTSHGLLKHWTGALVANEAWGLRGRFKKSDAGFFSYSHDEKSPKDPPPGLPMGNLRDGFFLLPKHGFTTAAWDPPVFGGDFQRVGKLDVHTVAFEDPALCDPPLISFGGTPGVTATYRDAGELFLLNSGAEDHGYAICQKCGFAESEVQPDGAGRINLPAKFEWHAPLNSINENKRCWASEEAPVWRHHHLAARQTTHLLKIDFSSSGFRLDQKILYTLGQCLRIAGCRLLELDEREIGLIDPTTDAENGGYRSIILYDNLAGGSGHLAELSNPTGGRARQWLDAARELLTVSLNLPEHVRNRLMLRRLLTAYCREDLLVPNLAWPILHSTEEVPRSPSLAETFAATQEDSGWTLVRLLRESPPLRFVVFCEENEIIGIPAGPCSFTWTDQPVGNGFPAPQQLVIVRLPGAEPFVAMGRWHHMPMTGNSPHRIRLRNRKHSVERMLTTEEFAEIRVLAIHLV